jgi:gluconate 5-dehydrogenase
MKDLLDLKEKVVIVTGGYGHLGTGMVMGLAAFGAKVIVAGRSKEKFTSKFSSADKNITFEYCDISSSESIKQLFEKVHSEFSKIDVVVNNAHFIKGRDLNEIGDEEWSVTMNGVLGAVYRSIREVIPFFKSQHSGKIINISSMYGIVSPNFKMYKGDDMEKYTNPPHYGAAKAGVIQLTKYYAALLGPYNIQVNCITPGPFPKPEIQENKEFVARLQTSNPLGKIGKPEDLVGPLVLLSSKGSDFITGQNIIVDGGWTIW